MVYTTHWPKTLGKKLQIDLKLDRMLEMMRRLGNPHLRLPPVIHIAGTNGKGSTTAYLRYILQEAGYKVHTYSSPHLVHFNERISLGGKLISDDYLFEIMERTRLAAEAGGPIISTENNVGLTLFEATTAASFIAFAENPADFLILEVGMGGRLDATNIIENTILSIITPVTLDHELFLGDNVTDIAHEKAGIIKKNIPCVTVKQNDEALKVLEYHAKIHNAPLYRYGYEYCSHPHPEGFVFYQIDQQGQEINHQIYPLPGLIGPHQIENATGVIAGLQILNSRYNYDIYYEDICEGLKKTYWPARLEPITQGKINKMLPKNWEIFLDGAHNIGGAEVLAKFMETRPDKPIYMVFGTTRGKQLPGYLNAVKPFVKFVCGVCVTFETNAYRGMVVSEAAKALDIPTQAFDYIEDAIKFIPTIEKGPAIVLICGSLYLAADIYHLNNETPL